MEILTRIQGERNKRVKKHNNLVQSNQKKELSVLAQKLLLYVFTIKYNQDESNKIYYRDFLTSVGGKSKIHIDIACQQLSTQTIHIDLSSNNFLDKKYIPIFEVIHLKGSYVYYIFNRRIKEYINPTGNYLSFDYMNVINLRKDHTPRLYELLRNGVGKYPTKMYSCLDLIEKLGLNKHNYLNKKGDGYSFSTLTEMIKEKISHINEHTDINITFVTNKKRNYSNYIFYREKKSTVKEPVSKKGGVHLEFEKYYNLFTEHDRNQSKIHKVFESFCEKLRQEIHLKYGEEKLNEKLKCVIVKYFNSLLKTITDVQTQLILLESIMLNYINNDIKSPLEGFNENKCLKNNNVDSFKSQPKSLGNNIVVKSNKQFEEKLHKLKIRLLDIGLSNEVIQEAQEKYVDNPKWNIWPEINDVRMAIRDSQKFPNKYTLKKFILES
ncbi:replication initiation protein (plasmid) [Flammeovirga sp. MY04]|uniref:replication initiation protein n=1 Tax=Flammeovirga sp. MY04 TaxID=1191459 RepID=UPI00080607DE|nr:replication initiation protein [Flammeovirga sp. MY04]ANQ52890.1 replication initiation protein [Flammeovirga sp. MY04]